MANLEGIRKAITIVAEAFINHGWSDADALEAGTLAAASAVAGNPTEVTRGLLELKAKQVRAREEFEKMARAGFFSLATASRYVDEATRLKSIEEEAGRRAMTIILRERNSQNPSKR